MSVEQNSENVKHTPIPWQVTRGGIIGNPQIRNTEGNIIVAELNTPWDRAADVANAALIVTAVNAHAALEARVAALEDLLQEIEDESDAKSYRDFADTYWQLISPRVRALLQRGGE